eukprot:TRINITY_DN7464_c0_g1_i1.p1 TRINITY_DN7464_c0_g1~~TRINITY_DN7464_c0_g1_i1.p1  ORF type:complete len:840 (+),score=188.85 TRINITY_DN7464_c0_g1_i1:69-2588(+)
MSEETASTADINPKEKEDVNSDDTQTESEELIVKPKKTGGLRRTKEGINTTVEPEFEEDDGREEVEIEDIDKPTTKKKRALKLSAPSPQWDEINAEEARNGGGKFVTKKGGLKMVFRNIELSAQGKASLKQKITRSEVPRKQILKGISGTFRKGRLIAIMGPSGAGKTTLLSVIANRIKNGKGGQQLSGEIFINGVNKSRLDHLDGYKESVAFVMQDDVMLGNLNARELLRFSAMLRLDKRIPHAEKYERVEKLITKLALNKCATTRIGEAGVVRGVSGGERKRVSIGMELITEPMMVLLDEPTSGLDSTMALSVVKILKRLTREEGRTVIATIHQPSSETFYTFDDLYLLSEGNLVYGGPIKEAVSYFQKIGLPCPKYTNPSDHLMNVASPSWKGRLAFKQSVQEYPEDYGNAEEELEEEDGKEAKRLTDEQAEKDEASAKRAQKRVQAEALKQQENDPEFDNKLKEAFSNDLESMIEAYNEKYAELYPEEAALVEEAKTSSPIFFAKNGTRAKLARATTSLASRITHSDLVDKDHKSGDSEADLNSFFQQKKLPNPFMQFLILLWRQALQTWRNPRLTYGGFMVQVMMSLIIGVIFYKLNTNQRGASNRFGVLFMSLMGQVFTNAQGSLVIFPTERPFLLREYSNGMYGILPYYFAKTFIDLPTLIVFPFTFGTIIYWMVDFQHDAGKYFLFILFLTLMANIGHALGFTLSANLELDQALPLMPLIIMPLALLGGFFLNPKSTPVYLDWLQRLSVFYWSFAAGVLNEFGGLKLHCDPEELTAQGLCSVTRGEQSIEGLNFDQYHIWECVVILISFYIFLRGCSLLLLFNVVRTKGTA